MPGIKIEGIYSHMAAADWPDKPHEYADWQYRRFLEGTSVLKELGLSVPFMQLANTPGSIAYPNLRLSGICRGVPSGDIPLWNRGKVIRLSLSP